MPAYAGIFLDLDFLQHDEPDLFTCSDCLAFRIA